MHRLIRKAPFCALLWVISAVFTCLVQAQDGTQQIAELGECPLTSGQVIEDCRIGYRTFGRLNDSQTNVVILPTWLNGRSEDLVPLFRRDQDPMQLVDTSKYFGIAFDAFGDGVSSSPSNSAKQHGPDFPIFTMQDMVRAQYRVLTEVLHIKHVHAAIGLSMGGAQVFAWATQYPKFIDLAVPIVGSPQATSYDLLSKQTVIDAIEADPDYKGGRYTEQPQLKLANEVGFLLVATPQYRNGQTTRSHFKQWLKDVQARQRQDANDRVWQAKAILRHDVLEGRPLEEVAKSVPVKFLIIVAAQDRMVTPQPALAWAAATGAPTYISSGNCAHLIMDCDAKSVSDKVRQFLEQ